MTDNETLKRELDEYGGTYGPYTEQGWFDAALLTGEPVPPSTANWSTYQCSSENTILGACVAKDDRAARDYAEFVEDINSVQEVEIWKGVKIPRTVPPVVIDPSDMYIGFIVDRIDEDGRKLPWEYFEKKMNTINQALMKETCPGTDEPLPNVWDDWRSWHEGAYWHGDVDTVAVIETTLAQVPDMGMTVYSGFPSQFYLDSVIDVEKYNLS